VIDRRAQDAIRVVWLTDGTRPFIVVLIETARPRGYAAWTAGDTSASPAKAARKWISDAPRQKPREGCIEVDSIAILRSDIPLFLSTLTGTRSSFPTVRKSASPLLKLTLNSTPRQIPQGRRGLTMNLV
jgi:hypothetical protein